MALPQQQLERIEALRLYSKVLRDTRYKYVKMLENPDVSEEDTKNIWNASFVLKYMMASHAKYIEVLSSSEYDERALAVLGKLCDRLNIDPAEDLNGFIDEAQKRMQDQTFKADLAALLKVYDMQQYAIGIGCILMLATASLCIVLFPPIGI